jgi:hypothetical protein
MAVPVVSYYRIQKDTIKSRPLIDIASMESLPNNFIALPAVSG